MMDGYERLAVAVIKAAAQDYKRAKSTGERRAIDRQVKLTPWIYLVGGMDMWTYIKDHKGDIQI